MMAKLKNLYYILLQILFTIATISTIVITYERLVGAEVFAHTTGVAFFVILFLPAILFTLWMIFGDSKFFQQHPADVFFAVLNTGHVLTMFIRLFWVVQYAFIYGVQSVATRQFLEIFIPDLRVAIMIVGAITIIPLALIITFPPALIFLLPFLDSWIKWRKEQKIRNTPHHTRRGYPNDKRPF